MPPTTKTAVAKQDFPIATMAEIGTAGQLMAQAGFLGTRNAGEGFVVALASQQVKMSLPEFQQKFHYRQGRFSMSAHAILAEFENRGGKFVVLKRTPEEASIKLNRDGQEQVFSLTWQEALNEPFVYQGNESEQLKELQKPVERRLLKNKYQTPRSRAQMLWARVISDGVSTMMPGARLAYSHEEMEDVIEALPVKAEKEVDAVLAAKNITPPKQTPTQPTPALVSQPAPAPAPVQTPAEKSVFDRADELAAMPVDCNICPIGPEGVKGMTWTAFLTEHLTEALKVVDPAMTAGHMDAIRKVIDERNAATGATRTDGNE